MFNIFNKNKNKKILSAKDKSILDEWATAKNAENFGYIIDRLPNPDIVLKKTGKRIEVFRNLVNHYQVGTCLDSRKSGTKSKKWRLKENNCPKEHYKLYESIFKYLNIQQVISDILDAPLFGYTPIEILWKKAGSYIVPVKLAAKPQEWFFFNTEGEFFFKDISGKKLIDLDGFKFLLPRNNPTYKNPYGQAILSRCFWQVAFINGGMEFWVKFTEKLGMPYMFGKYDRSMTDKEREEFLEGLANLVQDAIGIIPSDGSVEIMQTGSTGNTEIYKTLVDKCENNISKSILGQTLTTDIGENGSYAASQTHACVRADIVNSDKVLVEDTLNSLIKKINQINFNDENLPVFEFIEEDLGFAKAERDNKVYALGVEFSEDYILRTYGFEKGDIKIVPRGQNNQFEENKRQTVEIKQKPKSYLDKLESITDTDELKNAVEPALRKIVEFFNKTQNAEEALEKIAELYPDLKTEELEKILTKVIFISDLLGRKGINGRNN